jgi:hypothetical protein
MKLTPEQQLFWDALHGAQFHAHTMARDILSVKGRAKRFHARIDQHMYTIMNLYTAEEVIRIVKTWLSVYQIPMDPGRMTSSDLFHQRYGSIVIALSGKIQSY